MNFSRVFPTFLWCFVYFTLTSSAPSKESFIEKLNKEMLQPGSLNWQRNYLTATALIAASVGKNVFNMPESLSEDCVRTAGATMDLLATPSAWNTTKSVLITSNDQVINEIKSGKISTNPMELFCQHINEEFKKSRPDFPNFEELKKKIDLPKPAKNYYIEIQPEKKIGDLLKEAAGQVNDPVFLEYSALSHFQNYEYLTMVKQFAEFVGTGKAIRQLSEHKTFRSTADSVFHQAFEDYIKEIQTKYAGNFEKMLRDTIGSSLAQKVDEYFRKNATLKEEYEKIKKEAVDHVNKTAKY